MDYQTRRVAVLNGLHYQDVRNKLTILGCGSAIPTAKNNPSGYVLEMNDKQFLIDCGEGVQNTMRQMMFRTTRLYTVFISHLHGDHCFGLLGLISTWGMMNRTQDLHIYAHKDLERLLRPLLDYHCPDISFQVIFHPIDPKKKAVIFEDRTIQVSTIPLRHSVPTCGFLFEEKPRRRHIINDKIIELHIPYFAVPSIQAGKDWTTKEGVVIPNGELTLPPRKSFRFAYCSDTGYKPAIVPQIKGVDVLFHEATYLEEFKESAARYQHSTAKQAAKIALKAEAGKLIIGHFSARVPQQQQFLDEAKEVFENVELAEDRKVFEFK